MSRKKKHVDYYQVLGVSRDATDEDIKKGYRKQALRWHPDKNPGDVKNAAEQFKIVSEAYQVLSDRRRRQIYDLKGCNVGEAGAFTEEDAAAAAAAFDINAFSSPADIYRQFFPEDAGFADLLDSLDSGKRKTRKHDVNDFNAEDPGAFAYGAAGAFDFNSFLSPADLYRQFFPDDKDFADFLDSFSQNEPQQAGNDRPTNDTASSSSDRQPPAGNDPSRDSKSSERDRRQQPGSDQHREHSSSSKRDWSQQAKDDTTKKHSNNSERERQQSAGNLLSRDSNRSERDRQQQPGNDQHRKDSTSTEIAAQGPARNKGVSESKTDAHHPEKMADHSGVKQRSPGFFAKTWSSIRNLFNESPQVDAAEADLQPASYIEQAQVLLSQRGEVYQKYEVAISMFKASKNVGSLAAQMKKIDADHNHLTQKIAEIQAIVKPLSPQAADKLAELQRLDVLIKYHLKNAVSRAEKFVGGSMEKAQYITAEEESRFKKIELLSKIDSVMASLYSH